SSGRSGDRRASSRFALLRLLLLDVADDLRLDRADGRADEGRPILRRPVTRLDDATDGVLETRHDVASDQLVALERGFAVGPLVRHLQQATESSGLVLQALDLRDRILDRADDGEAGLVESVDRVLDRPFGSERQ